MKTVQFNDAIIATPEKDDNSSIMNEIDELFDKLTGSNNLNAIVFDMSDSDFLEKKHYLQNVCC